MRTVAGPGGDPSQGQITGGRTTDKCSQEARTLRAENTMFLSTKEPLKVLDFAFWGIFNDMLPHGAA